MRLRYSSIIFSNGKYVCVVPYRNSPNQDNIGIEMPIIDDGFIKQGGRVTGGKCKTRQKVMMLKGNAV